MTYDMDNRLLTVTGGTAPVTMSYDPTGRLASYTAGSTTTQFLYDGTNLIGEYVGGSMVRRYMHATGTDQPFVEFAGTGTAATDASFLLANYQGSIIALTNSGGAVDTTRVFHYGPYGEPTDINGNPAWGGERFGYTGQTVLPEARLYYYKARVYDPKYGRFLQTDPIGMDDDLDLYAYVGDDPTDKSDSTGMAFGLDDLAAAGLGAVVGLGVETVKDEVIEHRLPTWGEGAGAAVGGALLADGVVNAPETLGGSVVAAGAAKGAVVGFVSNSVQQAVDIHNGQQKGYSVKSAAISTGVGAVTGGVVSKVSSLKIPKISGGSGNWKSVAKGVATWIENGNAKQMSAGTAVRGAIGGQAADAGKTAMGAYVDANKSAICAHEKGSCE